MAGGRFKAADAVPYIIAQVIGAILGAAIIYVIATGNGGSPLNGGFAAIGKGHLTIRQGGWHFDPTKWLIKGCSFIGLTRNLKVCPEDKIVKAKALMQLKRAQARAIQLQLPDAEQLLQKMEHEYALLVERMQAYYDSQKQLLQQKKAGFQQKKDQLMQSYNDLTQGTCTVKRNSTDNFTVSFSFKTASGKTVNGEFSGKASVQESN